MLDFTHIPFLFAAPDFPWERENDLERCIAHDLSSMPVEDPVFERLVEDIYRDGHVYDLVSAKYEKTRSAQEVAYKTCLKSIIWHLYLAAKIEPDFYLKISLSKNTYVVTAHANPYRISFKIVEVVKTLAERKLIELKPGFYDKNSRQGRETRLRASIGMLKKFKGLPRNLKSEVCMPRPVRFMHKVGEDKKELLLKSFPDHQDVQDAYSIVQEYNEMMFHSNVSYRGCNDGISFYPDKNGDRRMIDVSKRFLYAVAYRNGVDSYSYLRMHGAFWQNIPNSERVHIRIDGEDITYLDYSAQILNISASLAQTQIQGDAYEVDVPGVDLPADELRQLVKAALVIFLNSTSRKQGFKALRGAVIKMYKGRSIPLDLTDVTFNGIEAALLNKHCFLGDFMLAGRGSELFAFDAKVARGIMREFVRQGKVVLPIHDGFMVKASEVCLLEELMHEVWHDVFSTKILIKREF